MAHRYESKYCVICGKRYYIKDIKFYKVPQCEVKRKRWMETCGLVLNPKAFVCEKHFSETDFQYFQNRRRLIPSAVPLQFVDITEETRSLDEMDAVDAEDDPLQLESTMIDCGIQRENETGCRCGLEMDTLKKEIEVLKAENAKILQENKNLKASLSSIFTEGQIKKLMNPGMKINWTWEDISRAICCHAAGPSAYLHYYEKGFPLPHFKTLQTWCRKITVDEGILNFSIECLKSQRNFSVEDKICVISFNEMIVQEAYEYDPSTGTAKKPRRSVQMAIVRGLHASWKQPIYFAFDEKMTKTLINHIISAVQEASFPVVAIVAEMSPTNQALWAELEVSKEKPWFQHPMDISKKVFVFANVPHLLKQMRKHFLETGLMLAEKIITSKTIKQVIDYAKRSDVSIVLKLTDEHIALRQTGMHKLRLAAQLFSNTTAAAILKCKELGMEINLPLETSNFFKAVNDWFDVHNAKMHTFHIPGQIPFGLDLQNQIQILDHMDAIMKRPLLPRQSKLAAFQEGILQSNMALRMLHEYVSKVYDLSYVLPYRCNQDILESFFRTMQSKGGINAPPTPVQFKYRLRKYMLVKNTEMLSNSKDSGDDDLCTDVCLNNSNEVINSPQLQINAAINALFSNDSKKQKSGNLAEDLENIDVD